MFKNAAVVDIETDGIFATMIHCLCYQRIGSTEIVALTRYADIIKFLQEPDLTIIGHNFVRYDKVVLDNLLGFKGTYRVVDTLGLSWILQPERKLHGLESYGEDYGVPKPKITDWISLTVEEYVHRCTEDVKINMKLWKTQEKHMHKLYGDFTLANNFYKYIELKLTCVAEQELRGVRLDTVRAQQMIDKLSIEREAKFVRLKEVMPPEKKYDTKKIPAKIYKKDGSLSAHGETWMAFLDAHDLPHDHTDPVRYIKSYEEPNPNSTPQKKEWLYSLGWEPLNWAYKRDKITGESSKVEQIKNKDKEKQGEVCESVKMLFEKEPKLKELEGLGIISHRISVFKKFLSDAREGRLYQGMTGFTNTMRLRHTTIVNLPKVTVLYGPEIRSCLIADEGLILCGSDLVNVESMTRNHYIFPYDPSYVADMTAYGFDSHTDVAVLAGFISKGEEEFFKFINDESGRYVIPNEWLEDFTPGVVSHMTVKELLALTPEEQKKIVKRIKQERGKGKTVNFAAVYGVGAATLSRNSGLPEDLCVILLEVYWRRNWAVRKVAEKCIVKEVNGQAWLYNPISRFWYVLRQDKDRFSTLNQSTAVYVFDVWMSFMRKLGLESILQVHDETLMQLLPENRDKVAFTIQEAMRLTNQFLKLNVTLGCDSQFGVNYADCH